MTDLDKLDALAAAPRECLICGDYSAQGFEVHDVCLERTVRERDELREIVRLLRELDHFATWSALNRPEVAPLLAALHREAGTGADRTWTIPLDLEIDPEVRRG